jgi:putative transposase
MCDPTTDRSSSPELSEPSDAPIGASSWMVDAGLATLYVDPGAPWENGYAESFNSKVRDELLNAEEFGSLLEAKVLGKEWKREYNQERPHSSLGYQTPAEFGAQGPRPDSAKPASDRGQGGDG